MTVSDLAEQRLPVILGLKAEAKESPEYVVEECALIAQMMATPGWVRYVKRLEEREKRELKLQMSSPASENASEYADFMGFLKGLRAGPQSAQAIAAYGKQLEAELKQKEVQAAG